MKNAHSLHGIDVRYLKKPWSAGFLIAFYVSSGEMNVF